MDRTTEVEAYITNVLFTLLSFVCISQNGPSAGNFRALDPCSLAP